jgi:hypothetical protein
MKKFSNNKIFFTIIIIFILGLILSVANFGNDKKIVWGVTFSKKQAENLGIDWKWTYERVIEELPISVIRLPIYWDDVEKRQNRYDFEDYIWMINLASQKNIEIVLVLGQRVPRWPECHTPKFYLDLEKEKQQEKILNLITEEIDWFKNYSNIKKWQIENEPFLEFFGECQWSDKEFLKKEVELVKSLDERDVMITESGELSNWIGGAKLGDVLGVSMYRNTWAKGWGYFSYPLSPAYYYFKTLYVKFFTDVKKIVNSELQVEPWAIKNNFKDVSLEEQFYSMDLSQVKQNIRFAKRAGINEIYLWGVEWWWWIGIEQGDWSFWELGKILDK